MRECPSLWTAVLQPEEGDGLERFTDAPMSASEDEEERGAAKRRTPATAAAAPPSDSEAATGYDMTKRDPEWCGAEKSCMWEISLLVGHHHPSVAAMARALLAGTHVVYDGDPLRDLSMASFLDRWLQKKPKDVRRAEHAAATGQGDDTAAAGTHPMARKALGAAAQGVGLPQPWDGASFAALEEHEVAPPDLFLHKYFTARQAALKVAKANRTRDARRRRGEDDDSDGSGGGDGDESDDDLGPGSRRGAGDGHVDGLEFGSSSDEDDDLDAAMEAAEADEHGPAAGGVSAHEAALAAAWASDSDGEDDDLDASDSDEEGDPDAAPAFADADEYEDILAAGGVEPEDDEEDEADDEADEEELPVYISDGDEDGGWGTEEEAPQPAVKQPQRQSTKKAAPPVPAKAATPRAARSAKVTRAAPAVTPRPSKRARR
jgi:ribosome biogenesis protein MAK21